MLSPFFMAGNHTVKMIRFVEYISYVTIKITSYNAYG
jgi:hypothetical protein